MTTHASTAKLQLDSGSWEELFHEVYIGFVVGVMHNWYFIEKFGREKIVQPSANLLGFGHLFLPIHGPEREKTLKVVGVGYGRTGTYSLTLALEELGFPTLHTQHMYEHAEVFGMWIDEVFQPSIDTGNATLRNPNLQLVADNGFQATCDLPMALYYEQVMEEFPDCKFILTTRKTSEEWFRSWDTLTKSITQPARFGNFVPAVRPIMIYLRWLFTMVNKDTSYLSVPYPLPAQQKAPSMASYEAHNRKVRATIPKDRLLEYNVRDGWAPLCRFMEIDNCPSSSFPKTNSARSVQVQAISSFVVPFGLAFFAICWVFVKVFVKLAGTTPIKWFNWKWQQVKRKMVSSLSGGASPKQKS